MNTASGAVARVGAELSGNIVGGSPAATEIGFSVATGVCSPTDVEAKVGSPPAAAEAGSSAATGVILPTSRFLVRVFNLRAARPKPAGQPSLSSGQLPDFLVFRALFLGPPP